MIEVRFPYTLVNERARREKGAGRPPFWEMVFWWTRKPLAATRATILASVLPDGFSLEEFKTVARLDSKTPHKENPRLPPELAEKLKSMSLLDPFAGFGSIPLEAVRLGIGRVVAVELLPTAYVFLKAVLEYPLDLGKEAVEVDAEEARSLGLTRSKKTKGRVKAPLLVYDVAKWGRWVVEELRKDPDIRELYDEGVAVYIGTWEVRCPVCGRYTPLVGNWWLARTKELYAYMKPVVESGRDKVEIKAVEATGKETGVPEPNVRGKPEHAKCLLCSTEITRAYVENGRAVVVPRDTEVKDRDVEFYPRLALRDWSEKLEQYLHGAVTVDELRKALARPRLLVRVRVAEQEEKKTLAFEPATQEDNERLWRALEKLRQIWGDPDIPTEPLPSYDQEFARTHVWGFDKWFKLFNPRQLLTLVKLVKLIREAGKRVEKEKLEQGWDNQKAHRYAEAVTTYLALALLEHARYSSIVSSWNPTSWAQIKLRDVLSFRGIAMVWNFVEVPTHINKDIMYSYSWSIQTELEGLQYLVNAVSGSSSRVEVVLDDATALSKLKNDKFDLIVTDPPYRDDVAYAELSDFYYVWLKRVLREYHPEAFRYRTQWESLARFEVSYSEGRTRYFYGKSGAGVYVELLGRAFESMKRRLKDGGVLVVFFAHSSPEAWKELLDAAWRRAGFRLTAAYPVYTESKERVTAREKTALVSSILTVWRPGATGVTSFASTREVALAEAKKSVASVVEGVDRFFAAFAGALKAFTSSKSIERVAGAYMSTEEVITEASRIAVEALVGENAEKLSPVSLAYALLKILHAGEKELHASSQELITVGYGLLPEGKLHSLLISERILETVKPSGGANVAKQKLFLLLAPTEASPEAVKEVASKRKLDLVKLGVRSERSSEAEPFTNAVDVLHVLEYRATQTLDEFASTYMMLVEKYPGLTREAAVLASTIASIPGDPEAELCTRVLDMLEEIKKA